MTVLDLETGLVHWLEVWTESRDVSPARQSADQTRIDRYILPYFARRSVTRITRDQIQSWMDQLSDEGVGMATIVASLMILRQTLQCAIDSGINMSENPAHGLTPEGVTGSHPPPESDIIPPETVTAIANAAGFPYRALILFSAETGARWDECLGLRVGNIDLLNRRATIGEVSYVERRRVPNAYVPGQRRRMPMSERLTDELREHLDDSVDWRRNDWDWVFLTTQAHSHPMRANFNIHVWRPALAAAGANPRQWTFHALRHTAVVRMIEAGLPAADIARMVGHRSVKGFRVTYKPWLLRRASDDESDE